jgi:NADH-quinone oxidoreductase subunit G
VRDSFGAGQIGALASEYATTEEYALLGRLVRSLGSENIDFRLRQTDPAFDAALTGAPWLGMPIAELDNLDRVLIVGSFLRKDHPLMAQRLRQAAKRGTQILMVDSAADDPLMPVAARSTVAPSELPRALAEVAVALAQAKEQAVPAEFSSVVPGENAKMIAASLASGSNTAVLMGNLAVASAQASTLAANGRAVADLAGGKFGFLTSGGNTVGGYLAGAIPGKGGKNAAAMLAEPLKAYVVLHAEPLLDADNGQQAIAALRGAQFAVALTPYRSAAAEWADVMLPVSPFTETSGTFVNAQGLAQSFKGTVSPFGQTRPAWKVLRVLGNVLHLAGFDDETSESVRDAALAGGIEGRLSNDIKAPLGLGQAATGLERVADVPIYRSDAMVRRSEPLQASPASKKPAAAMNGRTLTSLGLTAGVKVRVSGGQGAVELETVQDDAVADRAVRISAAFENTAALGGAFGQISVERA